MTRGNIAYLRLLKRRSVARGCKGLWMDREILFNPELSAIEKLILATVQSLTAAGKDCWVSNATFADICGCKARAVSRAIAVLKTDKILHSRYKRIDNRVQRVLWV